jgi:hypothetical protein
MTASTSPATELCAGCGLAWCIYWTGSAPTTDSWACRDCGTEWTITVDPVSAQVQR